MPRQSTTKANDIDATISTLRQGLESLPAAELASFLTRMRDEQAQRILENFDEAWRSVESAADQHHALTGHPLPAPASIEDVFTDSPISAGHRVSRPDAWYAHEISFAVRLGGEEGTSESFIGEWVTARGGDARYATRTFLPQLAENGYLIGEEGGSWTLANARSEAWYDFQVIGFINDREPDNLPTSAEIHDHIIEQGGHGVEVYTEVLPRLQKMGRITEKNDGFWDTTTRKPDAWYDYTIASFVESFEASAPPSTKDVHDHVINQGGHGIVAVTDALPRLREGGILNEVEEDRWDSARRRPEAWYDFQVMSFLDTFEIGTTATSMQIHDHIIEQGGHGIEVYTSILPRLKAVGRINEINDGEWVPGHRRPRAWYDNVVISTIRGCDQDSLPTLKQLHDTVIERGGHGVLVATEVLPDLVASGELIEVEDGVFDVANRRSDAWFDQTVYAFIDDADGPVTTMEIYEHVMAEGGHGSQIVNEVFPRLIRAGLITEIETGTWQTGAGVPLAIIELQVFKAIREAGGQGADINTCLEAMDEDLADESLVQPALESLEACGRIESFEDGDTLGWRLPGAKKKKATATTAKPRRRRRAA